MTPRATPVATEVRLLCVALGVIGRTDWVVKTPDGRHLILDVKTGRLGDAKRKFAVQCKAYAGSEYIDDGNGGWVPIPFAIDQTEAILAHVDPQTGATALYRVDLVLGFYGATLAEKVRGWHKIEVLSPYTPFHPAIQQTIPVQPPSSGTAPQQLPAPTVQTNPGRTVPPEAALGELRIRSDGTEVHWTGHEWAAGLNEVQVANLRMPGEGPRAGFGPPVAAIVHGPDAPNMAATIARNDPSAVVYQNPAVPEGTPVTDHGTYSTVGTAPSVEELMHPKNTKSVLQRMASDLGCKDLAHDRKWLVLWIIATKSGADPATATAYAKSKGQTQLAGQIPTNGQVSGPAKASAAESTPFALKHIAETASVADIDRFRTNIVERSGDQAWTDEMAEAARRRVVELTGATGTAAKVLTRIAAAANPKDIADLWAETTMGGSAPENWTEELRQAADARLAAIAAAQPAPPVNPYGPQ